MDLQSTPTPYPEVNTALKTMASSIHAELGSELIGFYVYGSLANGDFDRETSDIDAVAVISKPLNQITFERIKAMHESLFQSGSKWIKEIELFYMPQSDMKKYDRTHAPRPRLHEGKVTADFWQGDDWVLHRHVLREQGILVFGPALETLIDPVSPQDIKDAVAIGILHNWWEEKILKNPIRLKDDSYQAHAILTMCRALFTLRTGKLASKRASAAWAISKLDEPFKNLVERAVAWKRGEIMNEEQATADFIRYTIGQI